MLKNIIVVLCLLISSSSSASIKSKINKIDYPIEIWEGIGTQNDNSTWSIRFMIIGNLYFIDYPSLKCGGKLIPISTNIKEYNFRERLHYGKSRCIDSGNTKITINDESSAKFSYYHSVGTAIGTLIRTQ